jgi:hypothetical protein
MMFKLMILVVGVLVLAGCAASDGGVEAPPMPDGAEPATMDNTAPTDDAMMKEMDDAMTSDAMGMTYDYEGVLDDVTGGETVQGVNTGGTASGVARAVFADDYSLYVTFDGLPDPEGTDFYEGWIVRKGLAFDVISTGKVEMIDGQYVNLYMSGDDLTDHTFYVLTIEPDDGDPAPAGHVVEGTMGMG